MNPDELKQIGVIRSVDSDALALFAAVLEEKTFADAEVVFAEGDPGDSMYFIVEGCIRVEKRAQADSSLHKTLAVLESGDYFGEMALLDQKPRSAAAVASGQARLLRLSKAAFDRIQRENSAAGVTMLFAMLRTCGERIRRLSVHVVVYDEVGKAVGESLNLQPLLDVILRQLFQAVGADWGLLLLRSQFSDRIEIRGEVNLSLTSAQRDAIGEGQGILGLAFQDARDRTIANIAGEESFNSCPRLGFETPSLLLSPIKLEGQLLGMIVLGGKDANQFDLNELNLVRGVSRQAAQAILNARHREEEQARSRHSRQYVRF
jgi:CRP-like cAMP-binding protein